MISIHNEEENAFILDTLKKQWKDPADILLGMFFDTDGKWYLQLCSFLMLVVTFRCFISLVQVGISCSFQVPFFQYVLMYHSFSLSTRKKNLSTSSANTKTKKSASVSTAFSLP